MIQGMGGRRTTILVAIALVALAMPAGSAARKPGPTAVIALVDSGINPYHRVFRDDSPLARMHPSSYIPGFPKSAQALPISLNERTYEAAIQKDCDLWKSIEPKKLYWFPGTKIIGGITFEPKGEPHCDVNPYNSPGILDGVGHGTMVASRAAANGYGACPACRIVSVQGFRPGVEWAGKNADWIDVQSNSWGPAGPGWAPVDEDNMFVNSPGLVRTIESAARKHLSFWATGNGLATRGGVLGLPPTTVDPRMTPSIVMVGGHDSGYINLWPGFPPHLVADSCSSWAAYQNHISKSAATVGSGTSAATPWAAGGAARALLKARRLLGHSDTGVEKGVAASGTPIADGPLADGRLRLEEWKDLMFKTATPRPAGQKEDGPACDGAQGLVIFSATPVRWEQIPEGYPEYLHIGYGAVDDMSMQLADKVLRGKTRLPDRGATDTFFGADRQVRDALHSVYRGP
jgi:hypothetical protein